MSSATIPVARSKVMVSRISRPQIRKQNCCPENNIYQWFINVNKEYLRGPHSPRVPVKPFGFGHRSEGIAHYPITGMPRPPE